ncbi:MAG: response regulator [Paracoccaceae bacterium]|nr:response regulator [Paracoccaceae bacterium]
MATKADRIIVVDDDPELRSLLTRFLAEHGFETRAVDGAAALDRELSRNPPDAIVLDLMMPGEDGLAICRRLRAQGNQIPIIMLTARGDPIDRIVGLETGVDDYLGKPFLPRELVARLNAILRRAGTSSAVMNAQVLHLGSIEINIAKMSVRKNGEDIKLSSREFALLAVLAQSAGHPLSRAQLIDRAFGREAEVTDRAIDVQITRLRRAIGDRGDAPTIIKTVRGVGYIFAGSHD